MFSRAWSVARLPATLLSLLFGLFTLGLGCDSGDSSPTPPEPGSLEAALAGQEGLFEAHAAAVNDGFLFVALAQRINQREPGFFTHEEIWVLTFDRRPETWTAEKVSRSSEAERRPTLALTPDGVLHLVWAEVRITSGGSHDYALRHAMRSPNGLWTTPQIAWQGSSRIGYQLGGADAASLTVGVDGILRAVFSAEYDDSGFPGPQVSVITYDGANWREPVLPATRDDRQAIGATTPEGGLVIAYIDANYGFKGDGSHSEAVMTIRSDDGGTTWNDPVVVAALNDTPVSSYLPQLAVTSNGEVYLAWIRLIDGDPFPDEVWFSISPDGGRSWNAASSATPGLDGDLTSPPYLAASPSVGIHLFYHYQPFFASLDGNEFRDALATGGGWTLQANLTSNRVINGVLGAAVDSEGCIHLVWNEAETIDSGTVGPTDLKYETRGTCPGS